MLQLQRVPLSTKQSWGFAWTEAAADGNCHQAVLKQELNRSDTNCGEASVTVSLKHLWLVCVTPEQPLCPPPFALRPGETLEVGLNADGLGLVQALLTSALALMGCRE